MKMWTLMAVLFSLSLASQTVHAHFPWLMHETAGGQTSLSCVFAEEPEAEDDPAFLKYLDGAKVYRLAPKSEPQDVSLAASGAKLTTAIAAEDAERVFVLSKDLGVMQRGGNSYLVRYYGKTGPALSNWAWSQSDATKSIALDVQPKLDGQTLSVKVLFDGQPVRGAEVVAYRPDAADPLITDDVGLVSLTLGDQPLRALRVKYVQDGAGEVDGKSYTETRHFTTLTFPPLTYRPIASESSYPPIPEEVTSFGAAVAEGAVYYYGGHTGGAHEYSDDGQAKTLWRLKLEPGSQWESLSEGPGLQGLALVAHAGKLIRLGGFAAKNKAGQEHDLWSQAEVSQFDLATGEWTPLSSLPEPRSSFDAAVLEGRLYVVGGWSMQGDADSHWHESAWSLDLSKPEAGWQALPGFPTPRRALSVAAYDGRLYAIGGMLPEGKVTTRVSVYDPSHNTWSDGPALIGSGMTGFGSSTFAQNGRLYVSTYDGTLQSLGDGENEWRLEGNLENARFFHRMLAVGENQLLILGGSSMSVGKFPQVEVITLKPGAVTAAR